MSVRPGPIIKIHPVPICQERDVAYFFEQFFEHDAQSPQQPFLELRTEWTSAIINAAASAAISR